MRGCLSRASIAGSRRSSSVTTSRRLGLCSLSATRFSNMNTAASCRVANNNGRHGNERRAETKQLHHQRVARRHDSFRLYAPSPVLLGHIRRRPQYTLHYVRPSVYHTNVIKMITFILK